MTIARVIENRDEHIVSCTADTPVREAVRLLAERRIGALPIFDNHDLVGIFSERDVVYQIAANGHAVLDLPVRAVMTAPPITVMRETGALPALSLMTRRRIRHLPVVENGAVIGFVSIGDLVKYRIERIENEAAAMRDYIQSA